MKVKFVRVKSIKPAGCVRCRDATSTYFGNYVANGFVVHNSGGMTDLCKQVKVSSFDDIVAINALYRPGPLRSGIASRYAKLKHNPEEVEVDNPILREITEQTFGLIIYQEQLMRIFNEVAGFDMTDVQKIRKLVAKSKGQAAINEHRPKFVEGAVKRGMDKESANKLFNQLYQFGCLPYMAAVDTTIGPMFMWELHKKILRGDSVHVLSYDEEKKIVTPNRIKKIFDTGKQMCYRIRFNDRELCVSGREFFLTRAGWRMLDELDVGSEVLFHADN